MKHTHIHTFWGWWWWKINSCVRYETVGTGRKGEGGMEVGEEGDYYTYRYTVTTRMTPALRWAVMRAILMFY